MKSVIYRPPDKRVHIALPVRISWTESSNRKVQAYACTYDIHTSGARMNGVLGALRVGDTVTLERGKSKHQCRVTWVARADSELRGQFGIECIDDRPMWEAELQETEETYAPIAPDQKVKRAISNYSADKNRRRAPRFSLETQAGLVKIPTFNLLKGKTRDLSETGCLVRTEQSILPGTDLKLVLNITDCDVTVKGQVRHAAHGTVGIEFNEIRNGDRPLLQYLLRKLAAQKDAASAKVMTLEFA